MPPPLPQHSHHHPLPSPQQQQTVLSDILQPPIELGFYIVDRQIASLFINTLRSRVLRASEHVHHTEWPMGTVKDHDAFHFITRLNFSATFSHLDGVVVVVVHTMVPMEQRSAKERRQSLTAAVTLTQQVIFTSPRADFHANVFKSKNCLENLFSTLLFKYQLVIPSVYSSFPTYSLTSIVEPWKRTRLPAKDFNGTLITPDWYFTNGTRVFVRSISSFEITRMTTTLVCTVNPGIVQVTSYTPVNLADLLVLYYHVYHIVHALVSPLMQPLDNAVLWTFNMGLYNATISAGALYKWIPARFVEVDHILQAQRMEQHRYAISQGHETPMHDNLKALLCSIQYKRTRR